MRRPGMTYRVHDFKYLTIGIDPQSRGGCYAPQAFAYVKWPGSWPMRARVHRLSLMLPHVSFAWALRLKRVGLGRFGFWAYAVLARLYDRLGK